jgi:hypothetical protein
MIVCVKFLSPTVMFAVLRHTLKLCELDTFLAHLFCNIYLIFCEMNHVFCPTFRLCKSSVLGTFEELLFIKLLLKQ